MSPGRSLPFLLGVCLAVGLAPEARAEADHCSPAALAWAQGASSALGLPVEVLSCPQGHVILGIEGPDSGTLKVDLHEGGQGGFRQVGGFALSPIVEVSDFSLVPEDHRRAFAALVAWLEAGAEAPKIKAVMPRWTSGAVAGLAGGLLLLGVAGVFLRRDASAAGAAAPNGRDGPGSDRGRALLLLGVLLAVLVSNLQLARPPTEIHVDGIRDLLMARNLQDGLEGSRTGSPSSAIFVHGSLWQRFVAVVGAGGDEGGRRTRALIWLAAALAPLLFLATRKRFGWVAAQSTTTLWAVWVLQPETVGLHWQPTLIPQMVVLWLALALLALGGSRVALLAAVAAFALGTQVHLGFLFLLPAQLILGWAVRRPIATGALSMGVSVLAWILLSPDALDANLTISWDALFGEGLASAAAAAATDQVAGFAPSFWPLMVLPLLHAGLTWRLGVLDRTDGFVVLASLSYGAVGSVVLWQHQQSDYYWVPLLALQCLHAGRLAGVAATRWLSDRAGHRAALALSLALVVGATAWFWTRDPGPRRGPLNLEEVTVLVRALEARELPVQEAWAVVRAGEGLVNEFNLGLWAFTGCLRDQDRFGGAPKEDARRLMLMQAPEGRPASTSSDLETIQGHERTFVLFEVETWVDANRARICEPGEGCRVLERSFPNRQHQRACHGPNWPFEATSLLEQPSPGGTLGFSVRIPAGATERLLLLGAPENPTGPEARCRGDVLAAEGLRVEETKTPGLYRLLGAPEVQRGELRVRWPWRDAGCFLSRDYLALPILELPLNQAWLLDED